MSTNAEVLDWTSLLRDLAAGVSIATLLVVPHNTVSPPPATARPPVRLISTLPDGPFRTAETTSAYRFGTEHGLNSAALQRPNDMAGGGDDHLASLLRAISRLPVETLADLVGVSRVRYHKWLKGEGASQLHAARLAALVDTFGSLRELLGEKRLRAYLRSDTGPMAPIRLIKEGKSELAVSLALRPIQPPATQTSISATARQLSGLPTWLSETTRLGWRRLPADHPTVGTLSEEIAPRLEFEATDVPAEEDTTKPLFARALIFG
jgi:hypothetical protein